MSTKVKCPQCNGRGQIGYSVKGAKGTACYDFECPFCKGRCWVSKKRAEKYEQQKTHDNTHDGFLCSTTFTMGEMGILDVEKL